MLFCLLHAVLKPKHHKKIPCSKLSFFALYINTITWIFSDFGAIYLEVIAIQQIMKDISQTFEKKVF